MKTQLFYIIIILIWFIIVLLILKKTDDEKIKLIGDFFRKIMPRIPVAQIIEYLRSKHK